MISIQPGLTRLAYEVHQERVQSATAHPRCDDEPHLRPERAHPRPKPRSLLAHLLRLARVRQVGQVS